ncbi:MAG: hypothetical protein KBT34_10555 [Prevotella sp.]|nr:hypothetical protein [Candidatus Prevotella equi]
MAKTTIKAPTTKVPTLIRCMDCKHAYLMQSIPDNPIVAECSERKERFVASTHFKCEHFEKRVKPIVINPMKKA